MAPGDLWSGSIRLSPALLLAALTVGVGLPNAVLLCFLGFRSAAALAACIPLLLIAAFMVREGSVRETDTSLRRFLCCVAVAAIIFALGGEGRYFYANVDWQVRDAVLYDLIRNPWPFAYQARGASEILRAPLGMYLLPSLIGKLGGMRAADLALLAQNALFLGGLLTLASTFFSTRRARLVALAVFVAFSGLDVIGQLLVDTAKALDPKSHLDNWAGGIQFSSTLTLAFWVPQHALSGWASGLLFLLWRRGLVSLAAFLAPLPLLALWSPLGLLGAMPFVAYAMTHAVRGGEVRPRDLLLPGIAALCSLPSLLYLGAGGESVGMGFYPIPPLDYLRFQLLETIPYALPLWVLLRRSSEGRPVLLIALSCLLLFPFLQIGPSTDFMMRGIVPALTMLAVMTAEALNRPRTTPAAGAIWRRLLLLALTVGAATPIHELARAVMLRPSSYPVCGLLGVWGHGATSPSTYVARLDSVPRIIRPLNPAPVPPGDPEDCWPLGWMVSR